MIWNHSGMSVVNMWLNHLLRSPGWLYAVCVILRVCHALLVRTAFNPDEYWQSLEIAHQLVFGHGFVTWEWQPHARIRGFAHPLIFAVFYWVLRVMGLDSPWAVV
jgi:phosphatidylinositol glycan class B